MNSGFQMDTDINRRLTLKQTKQAALCSIAKSSFRLTQTVNLY